MDFLGVGTMGQTMDFLGTRRTEADHGLFRDQNNGGRPWTFFWYQNNGGRPWTFLGTRTMEADHGLFRDQNNGGRPWTF